MVEITYQMVLSTLQTIALIVGIAYYLFIMRNSQKNQELSRKAQEQALETRQAQLLSGFTGMLITSDSIWNASAYWFNHPKMEYKEFKERYPRDSDGFQDIMRLFGFYELIGTLSKWKLVDEELVDEMFVFQWDKFEPIVKGMQEDWGSTGWWENYEWLAKARLSARNAQES
jgi:hypothetical protein